MTPPNENNRWNQAAAQVDRRAEQLRRGVITDNEFVDLVVTDVESCLSDTAIEIDAADATLLVDYVIAVGDSMEQAPRIWSRSIPAALRDRLGFATLGAGLRSELLWLLSEIELGLEGRNPDAIVRLVALCGNGFQTHPAVMVQRGAAFDVLLLAFRFRVVAALEAAVRPDNVGRIGHAKYRPQAFARALNLLADIASAPLENGPAAEARDVLVALTGYLETTASAAVRLPVHLLTAEHRVTLEKNYAARVELAADSDAVIVPVTMDYRRGTDVLRGVLWQAADAAKLL